MAKKKPTKNATVLHRNSADISPLNAHLLQDYVQVDRNRFRPITMTSLVAILVLIPRGWVKVLSVVLYLSDCRSGIVMTEPQGV